MNDDATKLCLSALCIFTCIVCLCLIVSCVEYKHELKYAYKQIQDKDEVIDEQNSTIVKLLEHIKYMRGEM